MNLDTISPPYQVVLCLYCGKPVLIPRSIVGRDSSIRQDESSSMQHLLSRVFLLRCRACVREAVYTIDQVIASPETPTF